MIYPSKTDVYREVGLWPISKYIQRRRHHILTYIQDLPIFNLCTTSSTLSGTRHHTWWWEQPLEEVVDLDDDGSDSDANSDHGEADEAVSPRQADC